jgi:hypothetical protein
MIAQIKYALVKPINVILGLVVICFFHLVIGYKFNDELLYTRCGNWFIIAAIICAARPVIRIGFTAWLKDISTFDGGDIDKHDEKNELQKRIDNKSVQIFCPILSVIGIILITYGDLFV